MTFEDFFKRKKIDLATLQNSEPALFAEFEAHYHQMGEKSFDHTKKYWFNQLRRKYPLPAEVKAEKIVIENQLAEQTIADTLSEPVIPPSVGFKPKFKATVAPKPAEDKSAETTQAQSVAPTDDKPAASPGFKPRFKAGITAKPAEEKPAEPQTSKEEFIEDKPTAPAVGFKPRFKAGGIAKPAEDKSPDPETKQEETSEDKPAATPAVGFKPRFKAGVTKPVEEKPVESLPDSEVKKEEPVEDKPAEEVIPKPVGFKPRFNAAKMKPKEPGEE